jgi:proteasome lid subunit RPN8/RPN11
MTTQARPFLLDDLRTDIRDQVYDHVFASDDIEVGGVLVGDIDATGKAEVHGMIPALEADGARASVTFTHEAWQEIIEVQDRDFPDSPVIVGWYHSHPGFGIFLSEHDVFIQKNFFREPFQLAYVVDPQAETEGIFGWRDGEIVLFDEDRTPRRRTKRRPTVVVSLDEIEAAEAPTLIGKPLEVVPDEEPKPAPSPVAAAPTVTPTRRRRTHGLAGVGVVAVALAAVAVGLGMSNSGSSKTLSTSTGAAPAARGPLPLKELTDAEIKKATVAVHASRKRAEAQQTDDENAKAAAVLAAKLKAQQQTGGQQGTTEQGPSNPPAVTPGSPNATTHSGDHKTPAADPNPLVDNNNQ